jgi:hypothetical protein
MGACVVSGVTTPVVDLAAAAAGYATRGIKVFPLWWITRGHGTYQCACTDGPDCGNPGKHPRVGRGGVNLASAEPTRVAEWWSRWPLANIGLPAGANDLAIIDIDPGKGGDDTLGTLVGYCAQHGIDLMNTRCVRTGSGGLHLYYRAPVGGIKTASKSFGAPGVDTRGRGGYVVAPPSLHASGNRYELMDSPGLAPWPAILTPLLETPGESTAPPAPDGAGPSRAPGTATGWGAAALRAECDRLRAMTQADSRRNDALNGSAYKIGRKVGAGLIDRDEAYAALCDAASGWHGHTAREIEATVRSGLVAGMKRPHTGPTTREQG